MTDPRAVWKSILRNHPFFQGYHPWGWDWITLALTYPQTARILRQAVRESGHDGEGES